MLTYGCESWKSTEALEEKLNTFENKCLRRNTNTSWKEFNTSKTLGEETKQEQVSTFILKYFWKYIGHVLRMDNTRLPYQAFSWTPRGKRKQGLPREILHKTITGESATINIQELPKLATYSVATINIQDLPNLATDNIGDT
jgi:hypothetical protein